MNGPLKWHGGKAYLARYIVPLMPPRDEWLHYVEPYFGGGAVLFANDPTGISEVVNDLDGQLTNFWRVLQDGLAFQMLQRRLDATPFSETEYRESQLWQVCGNDTLDIPNAARFFIRCRQSMAGRMKGFAPLSRNRTRCGMNEQAAAWINSIDKLPEVHARLRRVVILNHYALDVIRTQDGPNTLFYLDPPYLPETRAARRVYEHEMTYEQHQALLDVLRDIQGRFMLSGYASDLYNNYSARYGWTRRDFDLANHAAGGDSKRRMTESVWTNY